MQTLVYFSNSVQTAFQTFFYPDRFVDRSEYEKSAKSRGVARLRETWSVIEKQIDNKDWILGDRFSAADIYLFMLTTWLRPDLGNPALEEFPNVKRIADKVILRQSVQRVYCEWMPQLLEKNYLKTVYFQDVNK